MRGLLGRNPTLTAVIALGIVNHTVLTGSRVTLTLEALRQGASTATVGMLLALYALLPMVLAVSAGRLSDRIGVRRPMLVGSASLAVGAAIPLVVPGLTGLFISASLHPRVSGDACAAPRADAELPSARRLRAAGRG